LDKDVSLQLTCVNAFSPIWMI